MLITILNNNINTKKAEPFSIASSVQRFIEKSTSATLPSSSKASARRMRAESQSEQLRIEKQMTSADDLPLNRENATQRLQDLDQLIASTSDDFEKCVYTIEKLALHVYLGDTDGVVDCLSKLNNGDSAQSSSKDGPLVEGETGHILLKWANGNIPELTELAKLPDPILLLLLKAKGMPLPESVRESFTEDRIKILDERLKDEKLSELDREQYLQTRGFCQAMLGDYTGALKDYNEVIDSNPCLDVDDLPLIRGLIHF